LGRKVDLRAAGDLSRYFRDEVVRNAEVQYAAMQRPRLNETTMLAGG
jgi:hypothetical protein